METKEETFAYMKSCIKQKRAQGKESTADLYRAGSNWLRKFWGERDLHWEEITEEMVDAFEAYLKEQKLAANSRNSYLSNVRPMYNAAVKGKLVAPAINPFSHLQLTREPTEKRALPHAVTMQIAAAALICSPEERQAIDFYIFSYLACGMPFADMALLTPKNIHGDKIVYHRVKNGVRVSVGITPGMRFIINQYHREGALRLFPILPDTKEVVHEVYKSCLRHNNKCLKKVGEMLGLDITLTTYGARHSWASWAHELDIPIAVISQALGHTSEKTTRIYLAALSQEKMNDANRKVTKGVDDFICGVA